MLIGSETTMNYKDFVLAICIIVSIAIETWADEQQWVFQNAKRVAPSKSTRSHSRQTTHVSYVRAEDLQRGFITGGLFRYSRHPNFVCEQLNWYLFYGFGCVATVHKSQFLRVMSSKLYGTGL